MKRLLFVAAATALTASCSQSPTVSEHTAYAEYAAREVYADAYRHVQERFIDTIELEPLAVTGLNRLSQIDDRLSVRLTGENVQLASSENIVGVFPRPHGRDSGGWARITAAVLSSARTASEPVRGADPETLYSATFDGFLSHLDDYSRYTDARSATQARATREGFGGMGITIRTTEEETRIIRVLPGTPAERGGLLVDDVITHVDSAPLGGLDRYDVVRKLRGPIGSEADVTVERVTAGQARLLVIRIRREHVVPKTVLYERDGNLAYIRITSFNRRTTNDLRQILRKARSEIGSNIGGVVLDLRGNPGGLLDQAVGAADLFITRGAIVSTRGRHPASNSMFTATEQQMIADLPIAVLINQRSASAAEMLAAALQDRARAVVIGTVSHGKGSVQNVARMPNGGEFVLTWSRMLAPEGYLIDKVGVLPNICRHDVASGVSSRTLRNAATRFQRNKIEWMRYDVADKALATTLRSHCEASEEEPELDREAARQVLNNRSIYRAALDPNGRGSGRLASAYR